MPRTALLLVLLTGCQAGTRTTARSRVALLGPQLQRQDEQLIGQRFRTILDFENSADRAFVQSMGASAAAGHTGANGLRSGDSAVVNISSLLFGLKLPANWSLLGGYVKPAVGGSITATLTVDGHVIARTTRDVPAAVWAFAAIDLSSPECQSALPTAKSIELRFDAPGGFDLDDVLLVDNQRTLAAAPNGWQVRQAGLSLDVQQPGRPLRRIGSVAARADGWSVEEANAVRLRLRDATGRRQWALTADGRSVVDGVSDSAADRSPAEVFVDEATGHLDRETPGDADNDGYNETRAAYQLTATSSRLRLKLVPRGDAAVSPILEIRGMRGDGATVTVDGRLVDTTAKLDDGTLLVLIPLRIESPVEITVGIATE